LNTVGVFLKHMIVLGGFEAELHNRHQIKILTNLGSRWRPSCNLRYLSFRSYDAELKLNQFIGWYNRLTDATVPIILVTPANQAVMVGAWFPLSVIVQLHEGFSVSQFQICYYTFIAIPLLLHLYLIYALC